MTKNLNLLNVLLQNQGITKVALLEMDNVTPKIDSYEIEISNHVSINFDQMKPFYFKSIRRNSKTTTILFFIDKN